MGREPTDNSSLSYRYSETPERLVEERGLVEKVAGTFIDGTCSLNIQRSVIGDYQIRLTRTCLS